VRKRLIGEKPRVLKRDRGKGQAGAGKNVQWSPHWGGTHCGGETFSEKGAYTPRGVMRGEHTLGKTQLFLGRVTLL